LPYGGGDQVVEGLPRVAVVGERAAVRDVVGVARREVLAGVLVERLVELADRVVEVELLEHGAHVRAEPGDLVAQVRSEARRVGHALFEVVARSVSEGEAGDPAELRIEVFQLLAPQLALLRQHILLGARENAIQTAQHGERQR